ncbi:PHP domain-containing protein [Arthrobacter agilis]|uniref:PHP domain-containing protein n=1 Tax=Arthrobacter agilis TaxID=37921 RepID=UPI000B34DD68|nr:PHP domain-containing protein [Arthrobacter agilis]OUM41373.1 phosphatase [Arthrobacter agilis]PPB46294.1 PHP domain-containing protein [Arthrobacter agilis]TPV27051.1 PHP domain-containing protein [Arthrobacter agilis]VDR32795.1 error-prone DNA polymerase [Arthrobacter agilis]
MRIDLHTHSNVSDGTEDPAVLIASAAAAGLDAVALTDHDSTAGWDRARVAARAHGVTFIPGMEVSCRTDTGISVHVLSYLHDPLHVGLRDEIERSRQARLTRARRMVELMSEDYPISWELVQEHVTEGATVGRPHIADALIALGVVTTRSEAFESVLTARSPYWVSHYAPHPAIAVALIREAGGVPVFAHPSAFNRGAVVGGAVIDEMIDAGLKGLEVEHRDNPQHARVELRRIARDNDLLVTGSSDYHGSGKPNLLGENTTTRETYEAIVGLATGSRIS